eukprot:s246_g10.t1
MWPRSVLDLPLASARCPNGPSFCGLGPLQHHGRLLKAFSLQWQTRRCGLRSPRSRTTARRTMPAAVG